MLFSLHRLGGSLGCDSRTMLAFRASRHPLQPSQRNPYTSRRRPLRAEHGLQQQQSPRSSHGSEDSEIEMLSEQRGGHRHPLHPRSSSAIDHSCDRESPISRVRFSDHLSSVIRSGRTLSQSDLSAGTGRDFSSSAALQEIRNCSSTSVADSEIVNILNSGVPPQRRARKLRSRSVTQTRGCGSSLPAVIPDNTSCCQDIVSAQNVMNNITNSTVSNTTIGHHCHSSNTQDTQDAIKQTQSHEYNHKYMSCMGHTSHSHRRHSYTDHIHGADITDGDVNPIHRRPPPYQHPPIMDLADDPIPPSVPLRPLKSFGATRPPIAPRPKQKSRDIPVNSHEVEDPYETVDTIETMCPRRPRGGSRPAESLSSLDSGMQEGSERGVHQEDKQGEILIS